jgi:hypothetical protein
METNEKKCRAKKREFDKKKNEKIIALIFFFHLLTWCLNSRRYCLKENLSLLN